MARKINLDYRAEGNTDLFDTVASEWAKEIANKTKKTQVRGFYDKVLQLERQAKKEEWEGVLPFVKMLNSKVAYAHTRGVVGSQFQEMMTACINQVNEEEDLKRFKLFFEAVLGFFKGRD